MSAYIELVACYNPYGETPQLFKAPAWSNLKLGDKVIVETFDDEHDGTAEMTVEKSYVIDSDAEDEMAFILTLSRESLPLRKVLKKVTYTEFKYKEDDNE